MSPNLGISLGHVLRQGIRAGSRSHRRIIIIWLWAKLILCRIGPTFSNKQFFVYLSFKCSIIGTTKSHFNWFANWKCSNKWCWPKGISHWLTRGFIRINPSSCQRTCWIIDGPIKGCFNTYLMRSITNLFKWINL